MQEAREESNREILNWRNEQRELWQRHKEDYKEMIKALKDEWEENSRNQKALIEDWTREIEHRLQKIELKEEKQTNNLGRGEEIERLRRDMEKVMEEQDREHRRNNIIIQGLKIGDAKIKEDTERFLRAELGFEGEVSAARKVGKNRNVIVAKIDTFKNKQEIMKNKTKLRNKPIFINNDMTLKE